MGIADEQHIKKMATEFRNYLGKKKSMQA